MDRDGAAFRRICGALEKSGLPKTWGESPANVDILRIHDQGKSSEVFRIRNTQTADHSGPSLDIIAKMPRPGTGEFRSKVRESFDREIAFYKLVGGRADLPIPRCYFAESPEDRDLEPILLLEDLQPRISMKKAVRSSASAYRSGLEALADLHAAFWRDRSLEQEPFTVALPVLGSVESASCLRRHFLNALQRHGRRVPTSLRKFWQMVATRSEPLEAFVDCQPKTLVQNEMKLGHIFVDPSSRRSGVIIDWANSAFGHPVVDLGGILLHEPDALAIEKSGLSTYHKRLVSNLGNDEEMDFDELVLLRRAWPPGWMISLSYLSRHSSEELDMRVDGKLWRSHLIDWLSDWIEAHDTLDAIAEMIEIGAQRV